MYSFNVGITLERRLTIGGFYMKPIILETESLQLRPVEVDDYTQLWKGCFINWDVFEGQTYVPVTEKQLYTLLRKIVIDYDLEKDEKLYWAIVLKSINEVIGVIDVHGMSLGYNLGVAYRGFGYMTEAVQKIYCCVGEMWI